MYRINSDKQFWKIFGSNSPDVTGRTACVMRVLLPFLLLAQQLPVGQGFLIHEVSRSTHNDAPHSVGLLWMSEQLVSETSTWQHQHHNRQTPCPGGIQTHNLSRRAAADLCLKTAGPMGPALRVLTQLNITVRTKSSQVTHIVCHVEEHVPNLNKNL